MIPTLMHPLGISPAYRRRINYLAVAQSGQYIDTGYVFDAVDYGASLELKMYLPSSVYIPLCSFGVRRRSDALDSIYLIGKTLTVGDASGYFQFNDVFPVNQVTVFRFDDGKYSFDGGQEVDTGKLPDPGYSFFLFAMSNAGSYNSSLSAPVGTRIYYCKFYESGTLVRNFVPVLDKSGVPCMYDTVTRTLKYNAGSGTFNYA